MNDDEMLTTRQAAEALGVNDSRVRQLARAGTLPATRLGSDWLIRRGDLAAALARPGRWRPHRATSEGQEER